MSMALYDVCTHFVMQLQSISGLDSNSAAQKPGSEGQGLFRSITNPKNEQQQCLPYLTPLTSSYPELMKNAALTSIVESDGFFSKARVCIPEQSQRFMAG